MAELNSFFEKAISDAWRRNVLKEIIEKKISSIEFDDKNDFVKAFVEHVENGGAGSFEWDGKGTPLSLDLNFDEADFEAIDESHKKYIQALPEILQNSAEEVAKIRLRSLKRKWPEEYGYQLVEISEFRESMEERWGKALGLLRMLLTISRELGEAEFKKLSNVKDGLKNVMTRLHVRACQVSAEIVSLLENGFADGAMARWRTLHEICVVMLLMKEHGDPLAERYIDHQAIESKRGKDQYHLCHEGLGYKPMTAAVCRKIDRAYERALDKHGPEFAGPYGWAEGFIPNGRKRLSLGDLERAVGRSFMGSHYKLASYNVHAGPHALFFRLGLIENESVLLAGASNAGLSEPGQNAAVTLALITMLLIVDEPDFDGLVSLHMLEDLQYEIPRAFGRAENKLKADHVRDLK